MEGSSQHITSISGIDFSILDDTVINSVIFCMCLLVYVRGE